MPPIRDILYLKCQGQEGPEWYLASTSKQHYNWLRQLSQALESLRDGTNADAYIPTFWIPNEIIDETEFILIFNKSILISLYLIRLYLFWTQARDLTQCCQILLQAWTERGIPGQSVMLLVEKEFCEESQ